MRRREQPPLRCREADEALHNLPDVVRMLRAGLHAMPRVRRHRFSKRRGKQQLKVSQHQTDALAGYTRERLLLWLDIHLRREVRRNLTTVAIRKLPERL